jgi:hypothetical protein
MEKTVIARIDEVRKALRDAGVAVLATTYNAVVD